ncbi:MAG: cell division protein ZapA [Sphingomonadales bacterium]
MTLTVNGRSYEIACEDGQERRLGELATYIDGKMSALNSALGRVADTRLFLMTALVLADELFESRDRENTDREAEETFARTLDDVARRIEHIAERIEDA